MKNQNKKSEEMYCEQCKAVVKLHGHSGVGFTPSTDTREEWEKGLEGLCADIEVGNIDDEESYTDWKKDLFQLVTKTIAQERRKERKRIKKRIEANYFQRHEVAGINYITQEQIDRIFTISDEESQ